MNDLNLWYTYLYYMYVHVIHFFSNRHHQNLLWYGHTHLLDCDVLDVITLNAVSRPVNTLAVGPLPASISLRSYFSSTFYFFELWVSSWSFWIWNRGCDVSHTLCTLQHCLLNTYKFSKELIISLFCFIFFYVIYVFPSRNRFR